MKPDPRLKIYRRLLREAAGELSDNSLVTKILLALKLRKPPSESGMPSRSWIKKATANSVRNNPLFIVTSDGKNVSDLRWKLKNPHGKNIINLR